MPDCPHAGHRRRIARQLAVLSGTRGWFRGCTDASV